MGDLLPVIVADLSDASARAFLEDVASRGGECWVPLVDAPSDASNHLLEVYTPGAPEPLRLLASPLGEPSNKGFPLRLMPFESAESREVVAVPRDAGTADTLLRVEVGNARRSAPPTNISAEHAAALARAAPPAPAGLIGRQLAGGKLEIDGFLGQGMMGAVYKARHRELGMTLAVKVLHESYQRDVEFARRFYSEALAVSRLDHPNLVRVIDFGQEPDGLLYLAMEYLHGRSLREIEQREGPMPTRRIVDIMTQICGGLGHAHAKGILHRDVKPDNMVLVRGHDDDGHETDQVKVLDFGLALLRQEDAKRERFAGTPVYMSPEACRGEELDARSDVYACGIMLFEMATGTVPFLADNPMIVVNRHLSMTPPTMASIRPDVDPRLEWIVQRALKKSRHERHADMRELRADLKDVLRPVAIAEVEEPAPNSIPAPAPGFARSAPSFSIPPPAEARAKVPSWLEESAEANQRFLQGMATGEVAADMLVADPAQWFRRLAQEQDLLAFEKMLGELDAAIRSMARKGEARGMWTASNALHGIAGESSQRASRAAALLRSFADPSLLSPIAERLIAPDTDADTREAAHSLVRAAGVSGAYALYGARVRLAAEPRVRAPFVAVMKELGEQSWPVVRAALERIPDAALVGAHPVAADLAEDILAAAPAPAVRDESAGVLVQKYLRAKVPSLCRAATATLARLWAERARPVLIALLSEPDDGVRAAAIAGLGQIGGIDEAVVRRLAAIATRAVPAGHELRGIAVAALARADVDAQQIAVSILAEVVRDPAGEDATVVIAARSLLHLAGDSAKAWISERAERSPDPLRAYLHALVANVQGAG